MTLEEAIKHAEEVAEENQRVIDTGIVFDDVTIYMLYCDDTEVIEEHLANYQECVEKHRQLAEWLKDYKRLLEQESCGDAISREEVLRMLRACLTGGEVEYQYVKLHIDSIPSVNPQDPKTVLYSGDGYADGYMVYDMAECPNCGYEYEEGDKDWGLPFCPNCGQSLNWESEEENEDSN